MTAPPSCNLVACASARRDFFTKSARGGTRTRTPVSRQGILSPLCLPFHHSGYSRRLPHPCSHGSPPPATAESRPAVKPIGPCQELPPGGTETPYKIECRRHSVWRLTINDPISQNGGAGPGRLRFWGKNPTSDPDFAGAGRETMPRRPEAFALARPAPDLTHGRDRFQRRARPRVGLPGRLVG